MPSITLKERLEEPVPQCCNYARIFISLQYEEYLVSDKDYFLKNTPFWRVRGCTAPEGVYPSPRDGQVNFCPVCKIGLPNIRRKAELPEKVRAVSDGGYYCDTCKERLHSCTCAQPESMWELDSV